MGLLVSLEFSRFMSMLSKFGVSLKTAIMSTIADRHSHVFCGATRKSKLH
jgi:hypothetical protein